MNTDLLKQIKDEVAKDHEYIDFKHIFEPDHDHYSAIINEIAERYAAACVDNYTIYMKTDIATKEKSHFEDIPQQEICKDLSHNPPSHMVIPYGKQYVHICPTCGKRSVLRSIGSYLKG